MQSAHLTLSDNQKMGLVPKMAPPLRIFSDIVSEDGVAMGDDKVTKSSYSFTLSFRVDYRDYKNKRKIFRCEFIKNA